MRSILLGLLLILVMSCKPPTQHDPARYGAVTVWLGPGWLNWDKTRIREELVYLNRLGPRFELTTDELTATIRLLRFESSNCSVEAGRWVVGTRTVEIDPVCTPGNTAFRMAVGHEIGHVLGMGHICRRDRQVPNCSPVGHGVAMMNPHTGEIPDGDNYNVSPDEPTALDLAEFRRARAAANAAVSAPRTQVTVTVVPFTVEPPTSSGPR